MAKPVEFVEVFSIKQEQEDEAEIQPIDCNDSNINFNDCSGMMVEDKLPSLEYTLKYESSETLEEIDSVFNGNVVQVNQAELEKPTLDEVGTHFLSPVLPQAPPNEANCQSISETAEKPTPKDSKNSPYCRPRGSTLYQKYSCSICHTPYSSERGLTAHVIKTHRITLKHYEPSPSTAKFNKITKALKIIPSKIEIKDPKNSNNIQQYNQCPKCSARFFSQHSLKSHFSSVHGKVDSKTIIVPSEELPPLRMTSKETNVKSFGNSFDANTIFYQCTFCTTRFLNENSLKRHISNIHGDVST